MRVVNDAPTLIEVLPEATAGAYEIITGDDMPNPNGEYLVGLGKMNDLGVVTVAASVRLPTSDNDALPGHSFRTTYDCLRKT